MADPDPEQPGETPHDPFRGGTPRVPRVTNAILAAYVGFAVADVMSRGFLGDVGMVVPALLWGSDVGGVPAVGQRLLSSMFLHQGFPHLAINSLLLMAVAPPAEHIYGRARVLLAYVVAAVMAAATSAALRPDEAAVTASGAVFGLIGLLVGFLTFRRGTLPAVVEGRMKVALGVGVCAEVLVAALTPRVNNTLHLGGFVAGLLLAPVLQPRLESSRIPARGAACGLALAALLGAALVASRSRAAGTLGAQVLRAIDLEESGQIDAAIAVLEPAVAGAGPGSAERWVLPFAQNQLAWYCVEAGRDIEKATALAEDADRARPDDAAILDTLGYLYALGGRCGEAADAMGRAAEHDPGYGRRRDEVNDACKRGRKPNPDVPQEPSPRGSPTPPGGAVPV